MKSLLFPSAVIGMALVVSACSSGTSEPVTSTVVVQPSESVSASASSEATPAPSSTAKAAPATSEKKSGQRSADEFLNAPLSHSTMNSYGVTNADGSSGCMVIPDNDHVSCRLAFNDPPLVPQVGMPIWESNGLNYEADTGFSPAAFVGGEYRTAGSLQPGESVDIEGVTFEALADGGLKGTKDGHEFTISGSGEYHSDTFPPKPAADGTARVGTVCGQANPIGNQDFLVYVAQDGTNCNEAMAALDEYTDAEKGGQALIAPVSNGWGCSFAALDGQPDTPENRHFTCSADNGQQRVVLL
ncbi:hypothetical protein NQ028_07375 [Corynebacterium phoceense]|uniref:hypothetical protein n=1 Tax=Corynebacterium phoceense TaxID=1686286 RepID=UPI00211B8EA6|nr:hypothetical protein [Corynebacterium phoceense]MCQ9331598.1 hypothetical protein [Corynebacterium phoceense]MCQ9340963.1 hypothetical protein [Corynebacterium phoceense]